VSKPRGFSVRIFIPSGDPDELRIIEKSNWSGQGLVFPRSSFPKVQKERREQLDRTGVYVLWGPGESGQLPRVYVGEGDTVLPRLEEHFKQKDFWTRAVVFVSKDSNLNKAHVQYIESELVKLAESAGRAEVDNTYKPQPPSLSEADLADAEAFLADILLCLPVIGLNVFEKATASGKDSQDLILMRGKSIVARGQEHPEGFLVRAGAQAVKKEAPSIPSHLSNLRLELLKRGIFEESGDVYILKKDYTFSSPSTAAGVILGRAVNGRTEWKDAEGRTLKEIQEKSLSRDRSSLEKEDGSDSEQEAVE